MHPNIYKHNKMLIGVVVVPLDIISDQSSQNWDKYSYTRFNDDV